MKHFARCAWTLVLLSSSVSAADPLVRVGFADEDLTPKLDPNKPVYLAGFGHDRKATAVHDPIRARAIVLADGDEKIALVSVDVVGLSREVVLAVRRQLPGFRHVLVSSTHNHEGPDTIGLWGPTPFLSGLDPDYLQRLEDGIVRAVKTAAENLKPARAEIGTAQAPELLHDNREPFVKHDELVAIRFTEPDGKAVLGVVVQWNCHPETLGSKNTQISADFVGTTVAALRKTHQDRPVVYFTGTVGGLMTSLKVEIKGPKGEALSDGTFEKTEEYGRCVARLADKALEGAKPVRLAPFAVRTREVVLPMENRVFQLGWSIGVLKREAYLWKGDPYSADRQPAKDVKNPLGLTTEVGYLKLGELEIAAIPGEIYPELVLGKVQDPPDPGADFPDAPIEPAIYAQLTATHRMLIGLANDEIGYIIPKRQWDEKRPFCYGRTQAQYGETNSISPEAAPILCEAFRRLARDETDARSELRKLEGTWSIVKEVNDGKEMPAEEAKRIRVHFDAAGKWKVEVEGKVVSAGTTMLDPTRRPRTIDYTVTEGNEKGKSFTAIYELDGDSFKHCWVMTGTRPADFTADAGSGRFLTIYRRERKQ